MFGASTAPHVNTPLFVLNSKYDLWQAGAIIGAGTCGRNISSCSAPVKQFWAEYSDNMVAALQALPTQHGGFLSNCQNHCQSGTCHAGQDVPPYAWTTQTIGGTEMGAAFVSWYTATIAALEDGAPLVSAGHRFFETCSITPCGADTC
jgi:hypothetical protein